MKMPTKCTGPKFLSKSMENCGRRHLGSHELVRRMDRQGEVLIWRRKCSGYAEQRMGPKLMNCWKPEQMGTKEYGQMMKRIQTLENGRVPAKKAKNWRIEGQKKRITRKEYQRLVHGAKRLVEPCEGKNPEGKRRVAFDGALVGLRVLLSQRFRRREYDPRDRLL